MSVSKIIMTTGKSNAPQDCSPIKDRLVRDQTIFSFFVAVVIIFLVLVVSVLLELILPPCVVSFVSFVMTTRQSSAATAILPERHPADKEARFVSMLS